MLTDLGEGYMTSLSRIPPSEPLYHDNDEGSEHELWSTSREPITVAIPSRTTGHSNRYIPTFPLSLLLSVIVGGTQLTLGLVAWRYTVPSTQSTARVFADDLQTELLETVVLRLQTHIDAAERLTAIQAAHWGSDGYRHGQLGVLLAQLLDTLTIYKDVVATQTFTTRTGGLNGFFVRPKSEGQVEYIKWETDESASILTESAVDPSSGAQLHVLSQRFGYNASEEKWVAQVGRHPTPSSPAVWSPAYYWGDDLWITLSRATFDSRSTFQGVACTDLSLGYISRVLSRSATSGTLRQFGGSSATLYVFEHDSTAVLGSSDSHRYHQLLATSGNRSLTFQEMEKVDPRLRLLTLRLGSESGLAFNSSHFSLDLGLFSATAMPIQSSSGLHWVAVLLFPSSVVHDPITAATSRSIGTVVAVVVLGIAMSIAMSLAISRMLHRIANDMHLLAAFQFRQVIASRDSLTQGTSNIAEVWNIQNALFATTKVFGTAVRRQRNAGELEDPATASETAELDLSGPQSDHSEETGRGTVHGDRRSAAPQEIATTMLTTSATASTVALSSQASSAMLAGNHHMGPLLVTSPKTIQEDVWS